MSLQRQNKKGKTILGQGKTILDCLTSQKPSRKTILKGQDNSTTREDNSRLPNKPKTCQKDNLEGARQLWHKGRQFIPSVRQFNCLGKIQPSARQSDCLARGKVGQFWLSCRHPSTFGKTIWDCLAGVREGRTIWDCLADVREGRTIWDCLVELVWMI